MNDIDKFDRLFFGVHIKLCNAMEPSARLVLENAIEAIIDAGINPKSLKGKNIAVYVVTNLTEPEKFCYSGDQVYSIILRLFIKCYGISESISIYYVYIKEPVKLRTKTSFCFLG